VNAYNRNTLAFARKLFKKHISKAALILLEIEASQGMTAVSLAYDAFDSAEIRLHQDLAGRDRLVEIIL
jgi:hypothetical protein